MLEGAGLPSPPASSLLVVAASNGMYDVSTPAASASARTRQPAPGQPRNGATRKPFQISHRTSQR
eukprot:3433365-Prymnesium_polylepis.1